jgi:kumamolisin
MGLAGPAGASSSPKIAISQGFGAAPLTNLSVFGKTPPNTHETVAFILQIQHEGWLEAQVSAGMPDGYLSVSQFARGFGQPQVRISALESYLAKFKIKTTAYPDGLDVTAKGTAGEFDKALSVQQHEYRVPAVASTDGRQGHPAMWIHGTTSDPLLPRSLGRFVLSILGLDNYPSFSSDAIRALGPKRKLSTSATEPYNLTPSFFTKHYNLDPLLSKGATGAGQTIGIVTLAALNPADANYFWNTVLGLHTSPNRITIDNVDGGPGKVSIKDGSDETSLDVEQSGAIAPGAKIVVYQAPNTDYGYTDAFYTAASQNVAGSVSASWGSSETVIQAAVNAGEEDPHYVQSFDNAFLELAAQGQSGFVSSGDSGAYDALDLGTTNLAVDNPADSPWITAGGGTTLGGTQTYPAEGSAKAFSITIPTERTWGWDYLWPYWKQFGAPSKAAWIGETLGGSGGGFSVDEPTPSYQRGIDGTNHFSAVEYLTPTDYKTIDDLYLPTNFSYNPTPSVSSGFGFGRAVPDLSANADPQTGYAVYMKEFGGNGILQYGGTSFIGPQLNGSTAVINSYLGRRVGFWNPQIYRFAASPNSPFTPLDASGTSNDNLYYTGTPGQIYNAGSGLGTPNLAKLASDFGYEYHGHHGHNHGH